MDQAVFALGESGRWQEAATPVFSGRRTRLRFRRRSKESVPLWGFRLHSPDGIHFHAPGAHSKGELEMDLFDRFAGNDSWHTRKLLEAACTLTEAQLDQPLETATEILPWREKTDTLRNLLENIVYTKEVWAAALMDRQSVSGPTPKPERTPEVMLERLHKADVDLEQVFREVGARESWDETFVDALCEPPETFTFGGVFAHIMTFNGHRRLLALDALKRLGANIEGFGDPMEYEQSVAPWDPDTEKAARKRDSARPQ
jgi:AraC family transcriptional regulator